MTPFKAIGPGAKGLRRAFALPALLLCLAAAAIPAAAQQKAYLTYNVNFIGVSLITNLSASSGPGPGQVTLQWTAPGYSGANPPLSYVIKTSTAANIANYAQFVPAAPLSAFSGSPIPSTLIAGSTQSMVVTGLNYNNNYCFAIEGMDSGLPALVGRWLRSVPKNFNVSNCASPPKPKLPMAPWGLDISSGGILSWLPITTFNDGSSFAISSAPAPADLNDYMIVGATSPTFAPWAPLGIVSTATLTYDISLAPAAYDLFAVVAQNLFGDSKKSMAISSSTGTGYVLSDEATSYFSIGKTVRQDPQNHLTGSAPAPIYRLEASTQAIVNAPTVRKYIRFGAYKGASMSQEPEWSLSGMGRLSLYFTMSGGNVTASGVQNSVPATPENMSVYWYNGTKWLQLYGKVDAMNQVMTLETKYFGDYQLRTVERTGSFNFDTSGISNRLITPNGDGKNDVVVFTFDNPRDSSVTGTIYDLKGAEVATMFPGPVVNTLVWDAKSGGAVVPGGVYIYQISSEGKTFNGTVVVIK